LRGTTDFYVGMRKESNWRRAEWAGKLGRKIDYHWGLDSRLKKSR